MPRSVGLPESLTVSQIMDHLPVATYACDAKGHITYYNERAADLWGRTPTINSSTDRYCGSFKLYEIDGTPLDHDACWMALALREARSISDREILIERPDGSRRTALANARPYRNSYGAVVGAINVLVDISDRKEFEAQLFAAKKVLEATNRAKTDFLANVSHELRTPLNAIIGFAEGLHEGHFGDLSARQEEYVGHIVSAGKLLQKLVGDVLDISRIEAGELSINPVVIDIRPTVEATTDLLKSQAEQSHIRLLTTLPPYPVQVFADPDRIEQVLVNLIGNAIKFSRPSGSVSITVGFQSTPDSGLIMEVRDQGCGMNEEQISLALQPFRRVDGPMCRNKDGVGLGLPLAHRLIALHGGKLDIASEPGHGTTMRIWLPPERYMVPLLSA